MPGKQFFGFFICYEKNNLVWRFCGRGKIPGLLRRAASAQAEAALLAMT